MFLRTVRDPLHRVGPKEAFGARQWNTGNRHESRILNQHWTMIRHGQRLELQFLQLGQQATWEQKLRLEKALASEWVGYIYGPKVSKSDKRLLIVVVFVQLLLKGLFTSFHLIFWALLGWLQVLIVDRPPASKKKAEKRHGCQWVSKQSKGQGARLWYAFIIFDLTLIRFDHSNLLHRFYQDFCGFFTVDR